MWGIEIRVMIMRKILHTVECKVLQSLCIRRLKLYRDSIPENTDLCALNAGVYIAYQHT
jgi:hypothetical protein